MERAGGLIVAAIGLVVAVALVVAIAVFGFGLAISSATSNQHGPQIQDCTLTQAAHTFSQRGFPLPHIVDRRLPPRAPTRQKAKHAIDGEWVTLYCSGRSLGPATGPVHRTGSEWSQKFARTAHVVTWRPGQKQARVRLRPGLAAKEFSKHGIKPQWSLPVPKAWLAAYYAGVDYGPAIEPVRDGTSTAWQQQTYTKETGTYRKSQVTWSKTETSTGSPVAPWRHVAKKVTRFASALKNQDSLGAAQFAVPTLANAIINSCAQKVLGFDGWPSRVKFAIRLWNPGSASVKAVFVGTAGRVVDDLSLVNDKPWKVSAVQMRRGGTSSAACPPWSPPVNAFPDTYAVGDSVTVDAEPYLDQMGITVNAAVSRFFDTGIAILQQLKDEGELPPRVVIALGTNGGMSQADLFSAMRMLSGEKRIVLVTVREPRSWQDSTNATLKSARRFRNVRIADWYAASAGHPEWFAPDGIHLGPEGAEALAHVIANALAEP